MLSFYRSVLTHLKSSLDLCQKLETSSFHNTVEPPFSEHPWDQVLLFVQVGFCSLAWVAMQGADHELARRGGGARIAKGEVESPRGLLLLLVCWQWLSHLLCRTFSKLARLLNISDPLLDEVTHVDSGNFCQTHDYGSSLGPWDNYPALSLLKASHYPCENTVLSIRSAVLWFSACIYSHQHRH